MNRAYKWDSHALLTVPSSSCLRCVRNVPLNPAAMSSLLGDSKRVNELGCSPHHAASRAVGLTGAHITQAAENWKRSPGERQHEIGLVCSSDCQSWSLAGCTASVKVLGKGKMLSSLLPYKGIFKSRSRLCGRNNPHVHPMLCIKEDETSWTTDSMLVLAKGREQLDHKSCLHYYLPFISHSGLAYLIMHFSLQWGKVHKFIFSI